ncbi:hypothetical protein MN608_09127 [Microdochium nivale]|nr:hypothetical protein MN608_09127 [Microdochium nivale]
MGTTLSNHAGSPDARMCFLQTMGVRLRGVSVMWKPAHDQLRDPQTPDDLHAYGKALEKDYMWSTKAVDLVATLTGLLQPYRETSNSFTTAIGKCLMDMQQERSALIAPH